MSTEMLSIPATFAHRVLGSQVMVRSIATRIAQRVPGNFDVEDLVSEGQFGLMDAIHRFNPAWGVPFNAYGAQRIRGSIMDFVRSASWTSRSVVQRARALAMARAALENKLGRSPDRAEMARRLDLTTAAYDIFRCNAVLGHLISGDQAIGERGSETILSVQPSPFILPDDQLMRVEVSREVRSLLRRLPTREATVIAQIYLQNLPLRKIAERLGVSVGRVSQIGSSAMAHLQELARPGVKQPSVEEDDEDDAVCEGLGAPRSLRERQSLLGTWRVAMQQLAGRLVAEEGLAHLLTLGSEALGGVVNQGNVALLDAFEGWDGTPSAAFTALALPQIRDAMRVRLGAGRPKCYPVRSSP